MNIEKCSKQEQNFIINKLVEYNLLQVESKQQHNFIDLSRKLIDNGKIIAGIIARMYCWNIVYIDSLWVDSNFRGKKIGSLLLEEIENISRSMGASLIHLDTFDFQAKNFYIKHGYKIFGVLQNCPESHCRYYMKKNI